MTDTTIYDLRFHGRGGQGVVTGARLIAEAALLEEMYVHSFPAFGPERAGAPIAGFARISKEKFTVKTEIYSPNIVIVQDNTLLGQINVLTGIRKGGIIIINHSSKESLMRTLQPPKFVTVAMLNATRIAEERLGRPIVNTAMVGSIIRLSKLVEIESVVKAVEKLFPGKLGHQNALAIRDAYSQTEIIQHGVSEYEPLQDIASVTPSAKQESAPAVSNDPLQVTKLWVSEKWGWKKLPIGIVVPIPGTSKLFKTGDWASAHPKLIKEKCTSCLTCFFVCPDSAIKMDYSLDSNRGYPIILNDYCKGCGLCAYECNEHALMFPGINEASVICPDAGHETKYVENQVQTGG